MKKEVIFFVNSMGGGGAERVIALLSNHLVDKGHKVFILTLVKCESPYELNSNVNCVNILDLPVRSFRNRLFRFFYWRFYRKFRKRIIAPICRMLNFSFPIIEETSSYYYFRYSLASREFLYNHQGAVAFAFLSPAQVTLAIASRGLNIKTVYCERSWPIGSSESVYMKEIRDKYARKYRSSVYQTQEQMEYYSKIINGKKYLILNPVKSELPSPYLGEREKRIICYCRLSPPKNLPLLIDSFYDIHQKFPEFILEIYGTGPEEKRIRSIIKKYKLDNSVYLKSFCKTIHQEVLRAAMFVSTSDYEGLSNSMLESMAIGLPCICTDCDGGGAKAVIKDGENGILVPKRDKESVVGAIEKLILNPDYANWLGRNAAKIREELSVDKIVKQWMEIIND